MLDVSVSTKVGLLSDPVLDGGLLTGASVTASPVLDLYVSVVAGTLNGSFLQQEGVLPTPPDKGASPGFPPTKPL